MTRWPRALVLAGVLLGCGTALAQWQWVEADGRKVFSDLPPPATVPDQSILKRPAARAVPSAPASAAVADAPRLPARDASLHQRRLQAEAAEQAKLQAEQERLAQARAENCERARRAKATLDSGVRIVSTNARGEREIMDDAARERETRRLGEILRADCAPPAAQ
jgi:hypothetical protein